MREWLRQAEIECREAIEFLIIPFIGACLPYPIGLRWFKLMARLPWIYAPGVQSAFDNAVALGVADADDFRTWSVRTKVSQMIDHADVFFLWTRGRGYFSRYVSHNFNEIDWVNADAVFFPHYGTGGWLYFFLAQQQRDNVLLVNPLPKSTWLSKNWARIRLYKLRERVFAKRLCTRFMSPGDLLSIRKVLQKKEIILISADMPVRAEMKSYQPSTALGKLNVAASFFDLAARRDLSVVHVVLGFDYASGKREFQAVASSGQDAASHAQHFADVSVKAISARPWLWRMMQLAKEVLV